MRVSNYASTEEWEAAYAAYASELASFVYARLDQTEGEDILQETWSAFAAGLLTQDIAQPRAWLYRVARNRITDLHRRASGRPAFTDLTPDTEAYDNDINYPDPDDTWGEIETALDELPPNQREVFVRNELDGETLREIADDLSLPLKTVISRKGYARRRLQILLADLYENYFDEE